MFVNVGLQPLKATDMTNALHRALCSLMSADRARLFSWHSARIYLASALGAMKVKPSVIQAMLRWQTEESLRLYNRMSMVECGRLLDGAAKACIASVQTSNLPVYERFDFFVALSECASTA